MSVEVTIVPCLSDNYAYLVEAEGRVAVVDPGDAASILDALAGRVLDAIWVTHHHPDHTAGIPVLVARHPQATLHRGADDFSFAGYAVRVLATPGHTLDAVSFLIDGALFSGDTLFAAGCGRLREGSADMLFDSLQRINALPPETRIYCGHEYTLANLRFAAHVGLDVRASQARAQTLRAANQPTVPTTLAAERLHNVFLRAPDAAAFAHLRAQKDNFRV